MGGFSEQSPRQQAVWRICFTAQIIIHILGTKRGGLATYDAETEQFTRSIHNLESTYFRTKF